MPRLAFDAPRHAVAALVLAASAAGIAAVVDLYGDRPPGAETEEPDDAIAHVAAERWPARASRDAATPNVVDDARDDVMVASLARRPFPVELPLPKGDPVSSGEYRAGERAPTMRFLVSFFDERGAPLEVRAALVKKREAHGANGWDLDDRSVTVPAGVPLACTVAADGGREEARLLVGGPDLAPLVITPPPTGSDSSVTMRRSARVTGALTEVRDELRQGRRGRPGFQLRLSPAEPSVPAAAAPVPLESTLVTFARAPGHEFQFPQILPGRWSLQLVRRPSALPARALIDDFLVTAGEGTQDPRLAAVNLSGLRAATVAVVDSRDAPMDDEDWSAWVRCDGSAWARTETPWSARLDLELLETVDVLMRHSEYRSTRFLGVRHGDHKRPGVRRPTLHVRFDAPAPDVSDPWDLTVVAEPVAPSEADAPLDDTLMADLGEGDRKVNLRLDDAGAHEVRLRLVHGRRPGVSVDVTASRRVHAMETSGSVDLPMCTAAELESALARGEAAAR
ncbi:MAG TPA: hypothetical protein VEI02_03155 [Planctomycetota bacterium]|nr:hypothetical protein [Planctomycetota bacterium]